MTEHDGDHLSAPLDSEISLRAIVLFAIGIVLLVVIAGALMFLLTGRLRDQQYAGDPPPPALAEARVSQKPAGPLLQADPSSEMTALRQEENAELNSYGWVDKGNGIARVPIDRAIDLLLENDGVATTPLPAQEQEGMASKTPGN